MSVKQLLFLSVLCLSLSNCVAKKQLPPKNYSIDGQWQLIGWYTDTPTDLNGDGIASTDLYHQWDDCLKHSVLVLENNTTHHFDALWVYMGIDYPSSCPKKEKYDIRILPNRTYHPESNMLHFPFKYFTAKDTVYTLNDSILEVESKTLLTYGENNTPTYRKGIFRFRRLPLKDQIEIIPLLEAQDLFPHLTIYGTVQDIKKIAGGHILTVWIGDDNIFEATIKKENLWAKSIYKEFEKGERVILKGATHFDDDRQEMLVNMIYKVNQKDN